MLIRAAEHLDHHQTERRFHMELPKSNISPDVPVIAECLAQERGNGHGEEVVTGTVTGTVALRSVLTSPLVSAHAM